MRSWLLLFSAIFASVISVMSLVILFCLFLNFYHGDLFVSASERMSSRGIEVMIYLTPFLIFSAFICFWVIFRWLNAPQKMIEFKQISKVVFVLGLGWFSLIFFFQFLDGMINDVIETFVFGIVSFMILLVPLLIGLISGNFAYLKMIKYKKNKNKIDITQVEYTDLKHTVLD